MLTIISDMHHPLAVLQLPNGMEIEELREEYESIMNPGPNPWCHETDEKRQKEWVEKKHEREQFLTLKYGGSESGGDDREIYYSPLTFAHWLIRGKGATSLPFREHGMYEFD